MIAEIVGLAAQGGAILWEVVQKALTAQTESQEDIKQRLEKWIEELRAELKAIDATLAAHDAAADKALKDAEASSQK
jgi:hypothetical protein